MKVLLLHSFLFIQILGYTSPTDQLFVLSKDTVIPDKGESPVYDPSVLPVYPGGEIQMIKDLQDNLIYPKLEFERGIQGTVIVQFYVEKDGSISDIKVVRGIKDGGNLDRAAMQAVKKLKNFIPAKDHKGEPMRTALTLPVRFKLPEETDVKPKKY